MTIFSAGCMTYGDPNWRPWTLGEKEAFEHIKYAFDNGINTFDTANAYSNGESERLLGKALKHHKIPREEVVILTKVFFTVRRDGKDMGNQDLDADGYVNQYGLSRKHIFDSIKASLQRLDVEYVDILQCHRFDPGTPIEETMRALHDVVRAGHVRYIGMSSCWAWQFHAMQSYAIQNNLTPFISMQNLYNLVYREEEREMMPLLKHLGVGCIPWSPLARGALTRPWDDKSIRSESDALIAKGKDAPASKVIVERVEELAKKKNVKMAQIAIAWNIKKTTAPIVGTTKLESIKDAIEAVKIELTHEEITYLEEPYRPRAVVGHA